MATALDVLIVAAERANSCEVTGKTQKQLLDLARGAGIRMSERKFRGSLRQLEAEGRVTVGETFVDMPDGKVRRGVNTYIVHEFRPLGVAFRLLSESDAGQVYEIIVSPDLPTLDEQIVTDHEKAMADLEGFELPYWPLTQCSLP